MKFLKFEDNVINIDEIQRISIFEYSSRKFYVYIYLKKENTIISGGPYFTRSEAQEEIDRIFKEISEN